jgi:hypothetical protein
VVEVHQVVLQEVVEEITKTYIFIFLN